MQDRYAGDLGDFLELGLLRGLVAPRSRRCDSGWESCGTWRRRINTMPTASTFCTSTHRVDEVTEIIRSDRNTVTLPGHH